MKNQRRQFGLTLTELLVTVAIAAVLMAVAVPAARRITESMRDSAGARALIGAALNNARAIAVREGTYAGVRFQHSVADGRLYMIFIVRDTPANMGGLANGFRVLPGRKPIALPDDVGIIAGDVFNAAASNPIPMNLATANTALNTDGNQFQWKAVDAGWINAHTFSIIFNSSGRLVTQPVRVRNKDGKYHGETPLSNDAVFNTQPRVDSGVGVFYQDDYPAPSMPTNPNLGLAEENSVNRFWLYIKSDMQAVGKDNRWSGYLRYINPLMVSPYTGELIGE